MSTIYANRVVIMGIPRLYRLGDTVYFYDRCNTDTDPMVGTIVEIGEDNVVSINTQMREGYRTVVRNGICPLGDPRLLENKAYRDRGCWTPQITVQEADAMLMARSTAALMQG